MRPILQHSKMTIDFVAKQTSKVILFYSGGKDSLVLLDLMSSYFEEIHCVFMYFVKELVHQQNILKYPEIKYKNCIVHQYPHWMVSHYIRNSYCQFHNSKYYIKKTPIVKLSDIEERARKDTGAEWIFSGWKKSDSFQRNIILHSYKYDAINEKTKKIYPLSFWKKQEVLSYLKNNRIIMPIEYSTSKSNGIDLSLNVLLFLKSNYNEDYNKILKLFPFAEGIVYEYEYTKSKQISEIRS